MSLAENVTPPSQEPLGTMMGIFQVPSGTSSGDGTEPVQVTPKIKNLIHKVLAAIGVISLKSPKENNPGLIAAVFANNIGLLSKCLAASAPLEEIDREGRTALLNAVIDNRIEMVAMLLDAGANVNAQDSGGWSSLHIAAQEQLPAMVTLLISWGAIVDSEDNYGNTPLSTAVFSSRGKGEVIKVLLRSGADRHHANKSGVTPLSLAQTIANFPILQFFE